MGYRSPGTEGGHWDYGDTMIGGGMEKRVLDEGGVDRL